MSRLPPKFYAKSYQISESKPPCAHGFVGQQHWHDRAICSFGKLTSSIALPSPETHAWALQTRQRCETNKNQGSKLAHQTAE